MVRYRYLMGKLKIAKTNKLQYLRNHHQILSWILTRQKTQSYWLVSFSFSLHPHPYLCPYQLFPYP
jgi:hypothetical protein